MGSVVMPAAAALVVGAWGAAIWSLGLLLPRELVAWRRMAMVHGYGTRRTTLERLERRLTGLRRLRTETDLVTLLRRAGRSDTPVEFIARLAGIAVFASGVLFAADLYAKASGGDWVVPPAIPLLLGVGMLIIGLLDVSKKARARSEDCDRALGELLVLVALMTDRRGLQVGDAVRILSRCLTEPPLKELVDDERWRDLVLQQPSTTVELYASIDQAYRIPAFGMLAEAIRAINVGLGERDVYTRLARSTYQNRLAEARTKAARAKILITIPVAGMLLPLLILLIAPIVSQLGASLK